MLTNNEDGRYPKLGKSKDHPDDRIGHRLALAAAAAEMQAALDWAFMNGYAPLSDENDITILGLSFTIGRMLDEVNELRRMSIKLEVAEHNKKHGGANGEAR